ncbi:hypothetical protein AHAS_Ahas18G0183700 [Arachis hypogaea]
METKVMFYELYPPFIYEDPTFRNYYIFGVEPSICLYVLRDRPFTHLKDSPDFDSDQPYDFPLSWLYPDGHGYLFPGPPIHAQALY